MFKINEPCHEDWEQMSESERGRHCAVCDKQVVDFTKMTEAQSLEMLNKAKAESDSCDTGICGRVHADPQGHLRFKQNKRRLLTDGMAAMLALSVLAGCQGDAPVIDEQSAINNPEPVQQAPEHPEILMGEMIAEPIQTDPDPKEVNPKILMGDVAFEEPTIRGEIVAVPEQQPKLMGKIAVEPPQEKPQPAILGRIKSQP